MSSFQLGQAETFKFKIFSFTSQRGLLLFKDKDKLYYRSGLLVFARPLQIPLLFPFNNLFDAPNQVTFGTPIFQIKDDVAFLLFFFLDTDLSECPRSNYDGFLKKSLKLHKHHLDLLRKAISIKDFDTTALFDF